MTLACGTNMQIINVGDFKTLLVAVVGLAAFAAYAVPAGAQTVTVTTPPALPATAGGPLPVLTPTPGGPAAILLPTLGGPPPALIATPGGPLPVFAPTPGGPPP
jgi:hypothetical protein